MTPGDLPLYIVLTTVRKGYCSTMHFAIAHGLPGMMTPSSSAGTLWLVLLVLCHGLVSHASGQACTRPPLLTLMLLQPCREAVTPFSPAGPSPACCAAIKALGQPCLCSLISGPPISGVDIGRAMQLPGKCTIQFDPCNAGN